MDKYFFDPLQVFRMFFHCKPYPNTPYNDSRVQKVFDDFPFLMPVSLTGLYLFHLYFKEVPIFSANILANFGVILPLLSILFFIKLIEISDILYSTNMEDFRH